MYKIINIISAIVKSQTYTSTIIIILLVIQFSGSINDELSRQYYVFIIKSLSYFISSHHEYWVIDNKTLTSALYTRDKQVFKMEYLKYTDY